MDPAAQSADLSVILDHPSLSVDAEALRVILHEVIAGENGRLGDLSVVLTGHDVVLSFNRDYLEHDYVTDVLAFDMRESPSDPLEGEIFVDLDTAAERHVEFGSTFDEEVFRYAIHGLLHLLGFQDDTPAGKQQMHSVEDRYLSRRFRR